MIVGLRYSQNRCSYVCVLLIVFPVNLNLYPCETEVGKFSFSNLPSKLLKVSCHWQQPATLLILLILLKSELFCRYYPGNINCATEHRF